MRRFKQQSSKEECIQILKKQPRGVLSVLGDDDYPYGIPLDHWYCEENGKLYFHCAKTGHKLDTIRKHDKVSYCVYDQGFRKENDWALNFRSVVAFCRARIVDDAEDELKRKIDSELTSTQKYILEEKEYGGRTLEDIAKELKMEPAAVRMQLSRARKKLRNSLSHE